MTNLNKMGMVGIKSLTVKKNSPSENILANIWKVSEK